MALELVNKLPYDHPYRWDGTAVGGKKLWRPDELGASLVLWLDAEDTLSITLNGSNVAQWNDKSGNGNDNHVSNDTAATQPTYLATGWNGKPTVSFTKTGQEFLFKAGVSNFAANNDFTIASAFEFLQTNNNWDMVAGWRSAANSNVSPNGGSPVLQGMSSVSTQIGVHNTDLQDVRIKVNVTSRLGKKIATVGRSGGTNGNGGAVTVTSTGFSQPTYQTDATQTWSSAAAQASRSVAGTRAAPLTATVHLRSGGLQYLNSAPKTARSLKAT